MFESLCFSSGLAEITNQQIGRTDWPRNVTIAGDYAIVIDSVVYVGMGLDFRQILYRQVLQVKGRIAFRWVVLCCHQSDYLSDKKDSKTL